MTTEELPRLNGIIKALEEGQVAFISGAPEAAGNGLYDGCIFEMEHGMYDIKELNDGLLNLLNPRLIAQRGSVAPVVTPIVRIPPNSGEANWIAKQVLDIGVYGIVWPHIDTVEDAYNAVAAMRYPKREGHPRREPLGVRGDSPGGAVRYWGVTQQQYYDRADVWPLHPQGELLCALMIESVKGIKNLPKMLEEVPGISVIITGEGDLSQELGFPRDYDHPEVAGGVKEILDVCKAHDMPNGFWHTTNDNVERLINDGYRYLMAGPGRNYGIVNKGRQIAGRS
jgi:4-hydroxy-2-oxoheptanedioate aldolase